jgi:shikimate dehydrogenase
VNTLVRRQAGGWLGTNTDVEGFMAPLRANDWQGRRAVVLGCGGSALAVVAGLEMLGFASIQVAGRDPAKLEAFCSGCRSWLPQLEPLAWSDDRTQGGTETGRLAAALASADLVVNTTPVGMANGQDPRAASLCPLGPAALDRLPQGCTIYDLIYTPRPTALLKAARARGCHCIDGLEMLVQQGAAALTLWTGRDTLPLEVMREAALKALEAP